MEWLPDTNVWIQVLKQPGGMLDMGIPACLWGVRRS